MIAVLVLPMIFINSSSWSDASGLMFRFTLTVGFATCLSVPPFLVYFSIMGVGV